MQPASERHLRLQNAVATVIVVLFVLLTWQSREPPDLEGADEGAYIALSRSIEQGTYREIFQVGAPRGAKYPPLYPVLQATIRGIAGEDTDRIRFVNIVLLGAALTMLFLCARRVAGGWLAVSFLLVAAFNPLTMKYAGSLMSEPVYVFFTATALFAAFMADQSRRWAVPIAMAAPLLAFLTRTAGLSIVLALAIWFAVRRPRRELVAYLAMAAVIVGGWFVYVKAVSQGGGQTYGMDIAVAGSSVSSSVAGTATSTIERTVETVNKLATGAAFNALGLPTVQGTVLDNALWLAALGLLIPAGVLVLWKSWRAMSLYLMLYCGMLLVWPYPSPRLLSVIAAGLKLSMLLGANALGSRLHPRAGGPAVAVLVALLAIGAYREDMVRYRAALKCDRSQPLAPNGCHNPAEHAMINASAYLKTNSSPTDLVVTSKGPTIFYLSDRVTVPSRAVRHLYDGRIVDTLRAYGIRYVLMGQFITTEDGRLADLLMPRCRETRVEWRGLPAGLLVSILPPGETSDDTCAAIASFRRTVDNRDLNAEAAH